MNKPSRKHSQNPVISRRGSSIGALAAEDDDEFLYECFIDNETLSKAMDLDDKTMILIGRTGSGKTAILNYISKHNDKFIYIDPSDMSMSYVSNSDAIRFLEKFNANINLLFQILWKHVLCLEFIKVKFNVNDEVGFQKFVRKIIDYIIDPRKQKAIDYIKNWQDKFLMTVDENIKEIVNSTESKLSSEVGLEINQFKADYNYEKTITAERKSEIEYRIRNIIDPSQIADLNKVIDLLSEDIMNKKQKYYILIDKIDENWVDNSIKFKLVRSLIEALKSLKRIHDLKILVAIRTDVIARVLYETKDLGYQHEKYEIYFSYIKWNKDMLKRLANKRINFLYRKQYTKDNVMFEDVFSSKIGSSDAFDYIIDRTLLRPRDVINFINHCLYRAEGSNEVSARHIKEAEAEYSKERYLALIQEWKSAFPTLPIILKPFYGLSGSISVRDILSFDEIKEAALNISCDKKIDYDPMYYFATNYVEDASELKLLSFLKEMISILYRVGALAVKINPGERFLYANKDNSTIDAEHINFDTKIKIHPMLHRALNINSQNL